MPSPLNEGRSMTPATPRDVAIRQRKGDALNEGRSMTPATLSAALRTTVPVSWSLNEGRSMTPATPEFAAGTSAAS